MTTDFIELLARMRRQERVEVDAAIAKGEQAARANDTTVCVYCGRRWFTSHALGRAFLASYRPEAGVVCHLICWGQKQAGEPSR